MGLTITTVFIWTGVAAAILTGIVVALKKHKDYLTSYLQNFCGAFFIFSGAVKAVDPLGTAYKMEQYFAEFESVFSETWFSFIAPLFPLLSSFSVSFSVFMIILEIVLGIFLIIGHAKKLTSWAFLIIVGFFTFLTGFTYLTGYVPDGVNFFQFGQWGPYVETNMKVTDCGCFGDFLKLVPLTSFKKDLILLIPAFFFIFRNKNFHQLFDVKIERVIGAVSTLGLLVYCMSNYVWDIPGQDFRPFKEGVNIRLQKEAEVDALVSVKTIGVQLTNRASEQVVELPYDQYLANGTYKNYPESEWKIDYLQEEPAVAQTKISEFDVSDLQGNDVTQDLLSDPNYSFMIVSHKVKYDVSTSMVTVPDTLFTVDTVVVFDPNTYEEQVNIVRSIDTIIQKTLEDNEYTFDKAQVEAYTQVVNPFLSAAETDGFKAAAIVKYDAEDMINDFRHETQSAYPFYVADDILLKTIVRSNPGIVLLKDGLIVQKWHYKRLPSYDEVKAQFLK